MVFYCRAILDFSMVLMMSWCHHHFDWFDMNPFCLSWYGTRCTGRTGLGCACEASRTGRYVGRQVFDVHRELLTYPSIAGDAVKSEIQTPFLWYGSSCVKPTIPLGDLGNLKPREWVMLESEPEERLCEGELEYIDRGHPSRVQGFDVQLTTSKSGYWWFENLGTGLQPQSMV